MPGHVGRSAARLVLRTTGDAAVPPADPPDRDQRLTPRQGTAAGPWRSVRADRTVEAVPRLSPTAGAGRGGSPEPPRARERDPRDGRTHPDRGVRRPDPPRGRA